MSSSLQDQLLCLDMGPPSPPFAFAEASPTRPRLPAAIAPRNTHCTRVVPGSCCLGPLRSEVPCDDSVTLRQSHLSRSGSPTWSAQTKEEPCHQPRPVEQHGPEELAFGSSSQPHTPRCNACYLRFQHTSVDLLCRGAQVQRVPQSTGHSICCFQLSAAHRRWRFLTVCGAAATDRTGAAG